MAKRPASAGDKYDTDPAVTRMLKVLKEMAQARGFTQERIQAELGWGRSFISQMQNRHKELQVDPLLKILMVIGVEPGHYFATVFAEPPEGEHPDPVAAELLKKSTVTDEVLFGLIDLLKSKEYVAADEAAGLIAKAAAAAGSAAKRRGPPAK